MIVYIERFSPGGAVKGVYARPQPNYATEAIDDADPLIVAYKTVKTKRSLFAIRADILALSTAQKNNAWAALIAGNPPLWSQDAGEGAAALAVLQLLGASATLSAADILEAKIRAAAVYARDNPAWLVHPAFDATINVAGDA